MEEQKTGYFERNKHLAHGIRLDFMFNMLYGSPLSYAVSTLFFFLVVAQVYSIILKDFTWHIITASAGLYLMKYLLSNKKLSYP